MKRRDESGAHMTQVAFQPVSDSISQKNLYRTIYRSVSLDSIVQYIEPEISAALRRIYRDGNVRLWGVASSPASVQWKKLMVGDLVLFADRRGVFLIARVSLVAKLY